MRINQRLLSMVMLILLLNSFMFPSNPLATSWAYQFVVWQDYIYVVSEEVVTEIDKEIGKVTKYSDMESLSGNFSNTFEKGTKYFSIKGVSTDEAIAIEESEGRYIKATREGEYEVRNSFDGFFDGQQGIIKIFIFSILGILVVFIIFKFLKNNHGKR
ncbi:hypothetical protein [Neobacillus sp. FSL H8-0543]|uniref:hypothetical protein n=1 Tax=Neobacillus sp. FSL H8-0543 TaxID=2954672 RepID=UPI003158D6C6